jgi:HK97 family phage portal protein
VAKKFSNLWGLIANRSINDPTKPLTVADVLDYVGDSFSTDTGQTVNAGKVIGYAPLFQAVSMISGDCAKLPLNVYRKTDRGRSVETSHPVQRVIHRSAMTNIEINGYKFWRRYFTSALLWGNAWAYIDRNNRGEVIGLYQLLPDRTWMKRVNGKLVCETETTAGVFTMNASEVLHIEGLSIDNLEGANMIQAFRNDFATALAAKQFQAKFFQSNMSAGGILQAPPELAKNRPEVLRKAEEAINTKFSGSANAFKTIVLRDGFKWIATQIDPQKAQFTETVEEAARNVARMYNLSPSRLGLKDSQSYNSEEMARRDYYDGALSHWLIANQCECTTKLLSPAERDAGLYIENNINALLWADAKTRSDIAIAGINAGRFSPNETRGWENLDAYEGGDEFYTPLNMQTVSGIGFQPVEEDESEASEQEDPADEEPQRSTNHQSPTTKQAYRTLLTEAFERAMNRACIKADRNKPIADDRDGIIAIVDGTLNSVGILLGKDTTSTASSWFDSLIGIDASSLRATAEASSQQIIDTLLSDTE